MAVIASSQITLSSVVDIKAVYRYYLLQSSTLSKPSKPTTTPASTPSGWSASEPTYTEGSTNSLYTVDGTVFSDNTWAWADVQLSSSYEAAKAAYNKAVAANSTASAANAKLVYGTCGTAAGTAAKTVSITGFALATGAVVNVTFTNANTAANPTLNVNSTCAKSIRLNNANLTMQNSWDAGETVMFAYDGTYWVVQSARKTMIATNGLTGESLKRASVSVGYPDATTTSNMRAEVSAGAGKATSSVYVFPDYVNLNSGINETSYNESSFVRAYHGQVVSSATKTTKDSQGAEVSRANSTINVYPEYIDLVSGSVRVNGEELSLGGGTPTLEETMINSTYGVRAWKNSMGVVTLTTQDWQQVPAGAKWTTVVFGTMPEGWRPPDLLQQPVLIAGLQHVLQVLADGTVQLVRTNAQNGAADLWFTFTYLCA